MKAGGGAGGKPVVLFNRNRAFEAMRGMATDVLSHGIRRHDRFVQFADSVEDLWTKVPWLHQRGAASLGVRLPAVRKELARRCR